MAKTKKPPRGRPKFEQGLSRAVVLTVRIQPSERKAIAMAAKKRNQTVSEWTRATLIEAAIPSTIEEVKSGGSRSPTPSA